MQSIFTSTHTTTIIWLTFALILTYFIVQLLGMYVTARFAARLPQHEEDPFDADMIDDLTYTITAEDRVLLQTIRNRLGGSATEGERDLLEILIGAPRVDTSQPPPASEDQPS